MNTVNKVGKILGKIVSNPQSRSRPRRQRRSRRMRVPRPVRRVPRGILAGYGSPLTASFATRHTADGCIVRGIDLVTSPLDGAGGYHNISYFMTANPAAWNGTRIAAIAAGFQNYRPLKFHVHYRPQVGSTSTLSVFVGTLWQDNYLQTRSSIEPSLVTSPAGTYLPAWQSSMSVVPLGRNLPMRMFPIRDPAFETVPFSLIVRSADGGPTSAATVMPGRIFVEYVYEFRNAIGSGSGFQPSRVTTISISYGSLYSGTISLGQFWYVTTAENANNNGGWNIDTTTTSSSAHAYDVALSVIPIGAHVTYDHIVGSTSSGGATLPLLILKVNGSRPMGVTGFTGTLTSYLYNDNGDPD